ncbi:tyrosine-type recombinase/integrase [uncultured Gemmiger sp.]|uniref:tyrosine-type recombinase/integrase n=1 Tax=uncultured Gemmiger sp. TaxID=1623490 RepID=UPI0035A574E6
MRPAGTFARPARRIYPWWRAAPIRYQLPAALDLLLQGHRPGSLQNCYPQEPPQGQRVYHQRQGLGGRCVTAHQFRHEFASILYEANVGELEAQKLLGHSDITTTRRIYTHIRERQLENAAAQIENYIQTTSK